MVAPIPVLSPRGWPSGGLGDRDTPGLWPEEDLSCHPSPAPSTHSVAVPTPVGPGRNPAAAPSTVAVTAQEEGVTRTPGGLSPSTISLFFKFNFIEVLSLCDVLISAVQRRDLWVFVFFCLWFLPGHPVHLPVLYSRALFIWPLYAIVCIC